MASNKSSGSKLSKDRKAALLALSDSIGDAKAAAKFGLKSAKTVYNYRQQLQTDSELFQLYEAAKDRQDAIDDRVIEAEAAAMVEVWGAVQRTGELLKLSDEPATPNTLKGLAQIIEAAGKNADNRAEVEMGRRLLERQLGGGRTGETQPHPAPGGRVSEVGTGGRPTIN